MNLFSDFNFFACLVLISIPAIILGISERQIKYYGMTATLFFIWMAMGSNLQALAYLGAYCLLEFLLVITFVRLNKRFKRNQILYLIYIIAAISPLAITKIAGLYDLKVFAFLGISYMTFKSVQIIIEIFDGIIQQINPFDFMYLLLFFPTLTSGPIDRSRRFKVDLEQIPSKSEYLELLGQGLFKICLGIVYKMIIATAFYQLEIRLGMGWDITSTLIYMYSYGFYLFFDFAGYSLMAIGVSYIFGIRTPENFNKPFISKDIIEFWDRWHITLSHWFRDFIFSRIMMRAIKGSWFKGKLTRASFGFIINMTVMGVWHGLSMQYILYGLYHGILLSFTEMYQKKFKLHKKYKKEKWYKLLCWFITFNLIMFGFFIFSGRFNVLVERVL
ncbi:MAG: D-alanyl-lipoteichoic acid biosynthesis protein DltB [Clostridiales bacterium]|nr:D-alanyl-lipoteichoic acid biosynthesis protein DltB [Clostridiales bacterium]